MRSPLRPSRAPQFYPRVDIKSPCLVWFARVPMAALNFVPREPLPREPLPREPLHRKPIRRRFRLDLPLRRSRTGGLGAAAAAAGVAPPVQGPGPGSCRGSCRGAAGSCAGAAVELPRSRSAGPGTGGSGSCRGSRSAGPGTGAARSYRGAPRQTSRGLPIVPEASKPPPKYRPAPLPRKLSTPQTRSKAGPCLPSTLRITCTHTYSRSELRRNMHAVSGAVPVAQPGRVGGHRWRGHPQCIRLPDHRTGLDNQNAGVPADLDHVTGTAVGSCRCVARYGCQHADTPASTRKRLHGRTGRTRKVPGEEVANLQTYPQSGRRDTRSSPWWTPWTRRLFRCVRCT